MSCVAIDIASRDVYNLYNYLRICKYLSYFEV